MDIEFAYPSYASWLTFFMFNWVYILDRQAADPGSVQQNTNTLNCLWYTFPLGMATFVLRVEMFICRMILLRKDMFFYIQCIFYFVEIFKGHVLLSLYNVEVWYILIWQNLKCSAGTIRYHVILSRDNLLAIQPILYRWFLPLASR